MGAVLSSFQMKPMSTASDRYHHQTEFKDQLIRDYQAQSTTTTDYIKCMILNTYFRRDKVIASHIVGLKDENILPLFGYHSSFKWNRQNGLLLSTNIDKAYENMEITFLIDPATSVIHLQVLYDDVLNHPLIPDWTMVEGYVGWSKEKKQKFRNAHMTFAQINGCPLCLPSLVFPSKRLLLWSCKSAYANALGNTRSHECAIVSAPSNDDWKQLEIFVASQSPEYENTASFPIYGSVDDD